MKLILFLIALGASSVSAQANCAAQAAAIPACGTKCIQDSAKAAGGCGAADFKCLCDNLPKFQAQAKECVTKGCSPADAPKVEAGSKAVCGCVGAPKMSWASPPEDLN